MQTTVYVDVLLVLNYVVTVLLLACTAKLLGIKIKRRRIVVAALLGAMGSLTIFLPFMGFWQMLFTRVALSAGIVLAALPWRGGWQLLKGWFVFFAVNFFFAGVMLAIWMLFAPGGMLYYNGVVYFHVSAPLLLITTAAAYLLLGLFGRLSRAGRIPHSTCRATVTLDGKSCAMDALVDTGNSLCEPLSGIPVMVCSLQAVGDILEPGLYQAIEEGNLEAYAQIARTRVRLIPYSAVGGKGTLPALKADRLVTEQNGIQYSTELVYLAISKQPIGPDGCQALLNPDLMAQKLVYSNDSGGVTV